MFQPEPILFVVCVRDCSRNPFLDIYRGKIEAESPTRSAAKGHTQIINEMLIQIAISHPKILCFKIPQFNINL